MVEDSVSSMGIMITIVTISILTINDGIVIVLAIAMIGKINEHHPRQVPGI
jgi:VIT1/CCC1 family predicted Fe2+/Mn2+ transporter